MPILSTAKKTYMQRIGSDRRVENFDYLGD